MHWLEEEAASILELSARSLSKKLKAIEPQLDVEVLSRKNSKRLALDKPLSVKSVEVLSAGKKMNLPNCRTRAEWQAVYSKYRSQFTFSKTGRDKYLVFLKEKPVYKIAIAPYKFSPRELTNLADKAYIDAANRHTDE